MVRWHLLDDRPPVLNLVLLDALKTRTLDRSAHFGRLWMLLVPILFLAAFPAHPDAPRRRRCLRLRSRRLTVAIRRSASRSWTRQRLTRMGRRRAVPIAAATARAIPDARRHISLRRVLVLVALL